jgi:hypothetical protein
MKGAALMRGMRWSNWVGFLMLAIFLIIHEPIWLYLQPTSSLQLC